MGGKIGNHPIGRRNRERTRGYHLEKSIIRGGEGEALRKCFLLKQECFLPARERGESPYGRRIGSVIVRNFIQRGGKN